MTQRQTDYVVMSTVEPGWWAPSLGMEKAVRTRAETGNEFPNPAHVRGARISDTRVLCRPLGMERSGSAAWLQSVIWTLQSFTMRDSRFQSAERGRCRVCRTRGERSTDPRMFQLLNEYSSIRAKLQRAERPNPSAQ